MYYKDGVEELARVLKELGYELISSGGTAKYLREKRLQVVEVEQITGFPQMMDGRVKTLHPAIHGGILMREKDQEEAQRLGVEPIDVVVVNLYPFEDNLHEDLDELLEFIDIGGPALLRASAKNFQRVLVVCDPGDYIWVAQKLKEGEITTEDRRYLAVKAFSLTAYYDSLISRALADRFGIDLIFPHFAIPVRSLGELRYGENPHQKAWLLENPLESLGITKAQVLHGKEMSFNNYLDADSALRIVSQFEKPACVIVKHSSPCGVAFGETSAQAFQKAKASDPESAFGGIVAFNQPVDLTTAQMLSDLFFEVILAPDYEEEALKVLKTKKNLRLIKFLGLSQYWDIKKVSGGYLLQEEDTIDYQKVEVVSRRQPSSQEMEDMLFAFKVCKYAKSNAVVIAKKGQTIGIGTGNTSRIDSLRCAIQKAQRFGFDLRGAVMASEAFLPFKDSVELCAQVGISAIIQPGGSIRDKEVLSACDEFGIALVLTGTRHFRH